MSALKTLEKGSLPHQFQAPCRVSWVGQKEETDCAIAALAMVTQSFGLLVSYEALRQRVVVESGGATLQALVSAAWAAGMAAQAVRCNGRQLDQVRLPAIAHLVPGHYVVLFHNDHDGFLVGDPGIGLVKVSQNDFLKEFSGYLLLLQLRTGKCGEAPFPVC
jgi:ABC-type bacteriocin/lantibiotic exporter with double-glycine peptidase domain